MSKRVFLFLGILFSQFLSAFVYSAPLLETSLESETIALGSSTNLRIEISWPQEEGIYKFAFPQVPALAGSVVRIGESQETYLKGDKPWIKKSFQVEIKPQNPGEFSVNSFSIPYVKGEDLTGTGGTLVVPEFSIEVRKNNKLIISYAAAISIFLAAAAVFIFLRRRSPAPGDAVIVSDEDLTIKKIQTALQEMKDDNVKDILKKISDEFLVFLGRRYKSENTKLNEKALLERLKKSDVPSQERQRVEAIFEDIHRARYAGLGEGQRDARNIAGEMTAYINSKRILGTPS